MAKSKTTTVEFDDGTEVEVEVTNKGSAWVEVINEPPEMWLRASDRDSGVAHFNPNTSDVFALDEDSPLGSMVVLGDAHGWAWNPETFSDEREIVGDPDLSEYDDGFYAEEVTVVEERDE